MTDQKPDRPNGDGLSRDEQIIRQFFDDGANGNRARRALDRLVAAIPPTRDGAEGADWHTDFQDRCRALNSAPPKPAPISGPIDFDPEMLRRDALIREEVPKPAPDAMRSIPVDAETRRDLNVIFRSAVNRRLTGSGTWDDIIGDAIDEVFKLSAPVPPADGVGEQLKAAQHCIARETARTIRLEQTIRDGIEALEHNSTSAPAVECLKAALSPSPAVAAEPVAWLYENQFKNEWFKQLTFVKPTDSEAIREITPLYAVSAPDIAGEPVAHYHQPSTMHMGDCSVCGNTSDQPWHIGSPSFATSPVRGNRETIARRMLQTFEATGDVWFKRAADAISLPVQPGAGEREAVDVEDAKSILEEIGINKRIDADHRFSEYNIATIEAALRFALSRQTPHSSSEEVGK